MSDWRVPGGSGSSGFSGSGWQQEGFNHNLSGSEIGRIVTSITQHQEAGIQPDAVRIAQQTGLAENRVQAFLNENPHLLAQADPYADLPLSNYSSLEGAVDLRPPAAPTQPPAGPSGSGPSQSATGSAQGIYTSPGGTEYNTDPAQSVRLKSQPYHPPRYVHLSTDEDHSRLLLSDDLSSGQPSGFDRPGQGVRAFDHIRPQDVPAIVEGMRQVYRGAIDKRTDARRQSDPQGAGTDNASRLIANDERWMQKLISEFPTITKAPGAPIDVTSRTRKKHQPGSIGTGKKSKQIPNPPDGNKHPDPIIKTTPEKGTQYDIKPENSIELTTGKLLHLSMDEDHSRILPEGAPTGFYRPTTMSANAFNGIPLRDRPATVEGMRELVQNSRSGLADSRRITSNRQYLSGLKSNFPSLSERPGAPIGPNSYLSRDRQESASSEPQKNVSEPNPASQPTPTPRANRNSPTTMYADYIGQQMRFGTPAAEIARGINNMEAPLSGATITEQQVQEKMNELQLLLNRTAVPTTQPQQQYVPQPPVEPTPRRSTSRGQEPYFAPSPRGTSQPPATSWSRFNSPDPRTVPVNPNPPPQVPSSNIPTTVRPSDLYLRPPSNTVPATVRPPAPQASSSSTHPALSAYLRPPAVNPSSVPLRPAGPGSLSAYLHPAGMNPATIRPTPNVSVPLRPSGPQVSGSTAPAEVMYVSDTLAAVSVYQHPSDQDQRTMRDLRGYQRGRGTDGETYLITPRGDVHQVSNRPRSIQGGRDAQYLNDMLGLIAQANRINLGMNGLSGLFGMDRNWAGSFRRGNDSAVQASGSTAPVTVRPTPNVSAPLRPSGSQGSRSTALAWENFRTDGNTNVALRVHQFSDPDDRADMNALGGYRRGADAGGRTYVITPEGTAYRILSGRESYSPEANAAFLRLRQASRDAHISLADTSRLFGKNDNWLSLLTTRGK